MVNQTDYVNKLRHRMNFSYKEKFYLESIACSYAIIENRTKRICEHLKKSASSMSLDAKTKYIYNIIKNKSSQTDKKKIKLIGFLQYRIKKTNLLNINSSEEYDNIISNIQAESQNNLLISFRIQRNEFTHNMYKFDSNNPKLINFEEFESLAKTGIQVANELCSIASAMKRKRNKL